MWLQSYGVLLHGYLHYKCFRNISVCNCRKVTWVCWIKETKYTFYEIDINHFYFFKEIFWVCWNKTHNKSRHHIATVAMTTLIMLTSAWMLHKWWVYCRWFAQHWFPQLLYKHTLVYDVRMNFVHNANILRTQHLHNTICFGPIRKIFYSSSLIREVVCIHW